MGFLRDKSKIKKDIKKMLHIYVCMFTPNLLRKRMCMHAFVSIGYITRRMINFKFYTKATN